MTSHMIHLPSKNLFGFPFKHTRNYVLHTHEIHKILFKHSNVTFAYFPFLSAFPIIYVVRKQIHLIKRNARFTHENKAKK